MNESLPVIYLRLSAKIIGFIAGVLLALYSVSFIPNTELSSTLQITILGSAVIFCLYKFVQLVKYSRQKLYFFEGI